MGLGGDTGFAPGDSSRAAADLPSDVDVPHALAAAARMALRAPSVHNIQPWRWRVGTESMRLLADQRQRLAATDPGGRLVTLSCGVALHHARVALQAMGYLPLVRRLPAPEQPDVLAEIAVGEAVGVTDEATGLARAIMSRHTERGAFASDASAEQIELLRHAAAAESAGLHLLGQEQRDALLGAAERSDEVEYSDTAYRREIVSWTGVPSGASEGVPVGVASPRGEPYQPTGSHMVLFGDGDQPLHWLRAGEALSAVWLTAITRGLAVQPLSSLIEVPAGRAVLYRLLSGIGNPFLALRIGVPAAAHGPATPRRPQRESLDIDHMAPGSPS